MLFSTFICLFTRKSLFYWRNLCQRNQGCIGNIDIKIWYPWSLAVPVWWSQTDLVSLYSQRKQKVERRKVENILSFLVMNFFCKPFNNRCDEWERHCSLPPIRPSSCHQRFEVNKRNKVLVSVTDIFLAPLYFIFGHGQQWLFSSIIKNF